MGQKIKKPDRELRRQFTDEFKRDAVPMLLDGHSASSLVELLADRVYSPFDQSNPISLHRAGDANDTMAEGLEHAAGDSGLDCSTGHASFNE